MLLILRDKELFDGRGGALLISDASQNERAEILREKGTNRAQFFRGQIDKYTWVDYGSFDGYVTVNLRGYLDDAEYVPLTELTELDDDTMRALAYAEQAGGGLYRVENLYNKFTPALDSFVQGYQGVSSYNSTLSRGIESFYQEMLPGALPGARTDVQYYAEEPFDLDINTFLGVHYLLARFDISEEGYSLVEQYGRVRVYELAPSTASIGHLYAATVSADQYESLSEAERRELVNSVVVEDGANASGDATIPPQPINLELVNEGVVQGSYDSDSDLIAAISIPYNRG